MQTIRILQMLKSIVWEMVCIVWPTKLRK